MQMPPPAHSSTQPLALPGSGEGLLTLAVRRNLLLDQPELVMVLPEHGLEMTFDVAETVALVEDMEQLLLQMRTIVAQWFEAEVPGDDALHLVAAGVFDARTPAQRQERTLVTLCGVTREPDDEWLFEPLDTDQQPCLEHTCLACLGLYHDRQEAHARG